MPDMLAKLYWEPRESTWANDIWNADVKIHRPDIGQKPAVLNWILQNFSQGWMTQAEACFRNSPLTIFIAVHDRREIVGFACYDSVRRNFFGPMGVADEWRGKGVGACLLLHCFSAMREAGYEYTIIHAVGPVMFYAKACGAEVIPDSEAAQYRKEIKL
jgi:predicted N-acetyltransferase YhbS